MFTLGLFCTSVNIMSFASYFKFMVPIILIKIWVANYFMVFIKSKLGQFYF